jgi:5-methylcytosine-specific restriction enzyme A
MASGEFSERTRRLIRLRAQGRCEVCGQVIQREGQIHHRRPRGMGGTSNRAIESPANGLYLHHSCHHRIEMNREKARLLGHLLRPGARAEDTKVYLWNGWFILDGEGAAHPAEPPDRG